MYDYDTDTNWLGGFIVFVVVFGIIGLIFGALFISWHSSEDVVSGIVYNTKNDTFPGGNTSFSVRAAVDTYVTTENESDYCVPGNSPYKAIINKAAADKNIKVVVTAHKYFAFQPPWVCNPNITVAEESK